MLKGLIKSGPAAPYRLRDLRSPSAATRCCSDPGSCSGTEWPPRRLNRGSSAPSRCDNLYSTICAVVLPQLRPSNTPPAHVRPSIRSRRARPAPRVHGALDRRLIWAGSSPKRRRARGRQAAFKLRRCIDFLSHTQRRINLL